MPKLSHNECRIFQCDQKTVTQGKNNWILELTSNCRSFGLTNSVAYSFVLFLTLGYVCDFAWIFFSLTGTFSSFATFLSYIATKSSLYSLTGFYLCICINSSKLIHRFRRENGTDRQSHFILVWSMDIRNKNVLKQYKVAAN
jgi:hypothetical protein